MSIPGGGPYRVTNGTRAYPVGPVEVRIMEPWKDLTKGSIDEPLGAQSQEDLSSYFIATYSYDPRQVI